MRGPERGGFTAQVWVELKGDDPEADSALAVARTRLAAGRALRSLKRLRLIELDGPLPRRDALNALLDRSTRFYNPHKESCTLRLEPDEPAPVPPGGSAALVTERGGERREAAERWWLHETGERIAVREGVVWAMEFEPGTAAARAAGELVWLRDREHGLLCNPHSQDGRVADGRPPLPWLKARTGAVRAGVR
jgi:hypothetical protein